MTNLPPNTDTNALDAIWLTRTPVPSASGLAWSRGWLDEEFASDGIEVNWVREDVLRSVPDDADRQARTMFREGGNITALAMQALGADTRVIGLTWVDERQTIMVRPDTSMASLDDLKGMRIALPSFSQTRAFSIVRGMSLHGIESALALAGLTFDDVELVDVPAPPVDFSEPETLQRMWSGLDWLADGRVDAVYVKGASGIEAAQRRGLVTGIDLDAYPSRRSRINNGTPRPIIVHRFMIEEHFDIVVRFLQQCLRAADWAATHLAEFKLILQRETFAGPAGVEAAYRNDFHRALHPNLSPERIDMLRTQEQFLRRTGFLDRAVDVTAWIDPRPLEAALALRDASKAA
jgi:2'-hydroxybiphenyl-2-sulfinate desulfinase